MSTENLSTNKKYKKKRSKADSLLEQLLSNPCQFPAPGILQTRSNISSSSKGSSVGVSAYNRYVDDGGSVNGITAQSIHSQDTFSTYGEQKVSFMKVSDPPCSGASESVSGTALWSGQIVKSRWYKRLSITLIMIHCIVCAVATSDFATEHAAVRYKFDLAKDIFVYLMTLELLLHFMHHGVLFFSHGWLVFDFVWVAAGWAVPNLLVMRSFRVVRTMRLASTVRDLKELVLALLLVIPKMFAIFLLLLVLFFVFSILFTDLFKHTYEDQITKKDYFSSLQVTLFTLFQIMTLDGWSDICKQVMTQYEWAWMPFIGFVIVSSFFFLNLVIAVVCDAVTSVHRDTVVKYIQDDISAATSVREALQVEDKLEELSSAIQVIMHAQVTLLDSLQQQQEQRIQQEHPIGDHVLNNNLLRPAADLISRFESTRGALQRQLEVIGSRSRNRNVSDSHTSSVNLNPMGIDGIPGTPRDSVSALDQHSYTNPHPNQPQPLEPIPSSPPETLTIPTTSGLSSDMAPPDLGSPPLPHGLQEHEVSILNTVQRQRLVRVLQQDQFKELSATQRAKLAHALINRLASEGQQSEADPPQPSDQGNSNQYVGPTMSTMQPHVMQSPPSQEPFDCQDGGASAP